MNYKDSTRNVWQRPEFPLPMLNWSSDGEKLA